MASPFPGMGAWHHLVGVSDGSHISIYTDGELTETIPVTQQGNLDINIDYIDIGRHRHDSQNFGFFFGFIDELRIWEYALSQSEIIARMHAELDGDEQGLIAYWNFDDESASDLTGNGNDGLFVAGATTVPIELPVSQNGTWGDLNGDGQINISDVILLINHIVGSF